MKTLLVVSACVFDLCCFALSVLTVVVVVELPQTPEDDPQT